MTAVSPSPEMTVIVSSPLTIQPDSRGLPLLRHISSVIDVPGDTVSARSMPQPRNISSVYAASSPEVIIRAPEISSAVRAVHPLNIRLVSASSPCSAERSSSSRLVQSSNIPIAVGLFAVAFTESSTVFRLVHLLNIPSSSLTHALKAESFALSRLVHPLNIPLAVSTELRSVCEKSISLRLSQSANISCTSTSPEVSHPSMLTLSRYVQPLNIRLVL